MSKCDHCGACLDACFEPHVIEFIKPKYDKGRKEKGVDKQSSYKWRLYPMW